MGMGHSATCSMACLLGSAGASGQIVLSEAASDGGLVHTHAADEDAFPQIQEWMVGGLAVGDFNGDGFADLFVVGSSTTPDRLFINDGDGGFEDEATNWGVDLVHASNGVSVADFDGDGHLDIYVTSMGPAGGPPASGSHKLYWNGGGAWFADVAVTQGVSTNSRLGAGGYGSSWGDYDLDGDLDLFVTLWWSSLQGNRLFRNDGDGFTDVTFAALGNSLLNIWGFQASFTDMNGDLYPELLVSADFETSRYLVNDGDGTFHEATLESGTGLDRNGMGQTVGDFDNDGLLDWYVTSIHHARAPPEDHRGNMLYTQTGDHQYTERSHDTECNDGGWGWGTVAVDLDQDGWLDLVEVNGRPADVGEWANEAGKVFHNQGDGTFEEIGDAAGFGSPSEGRGLAVLDADRDGDMDVVVLANNGPLEYYRNDTDGGDWLQIELDTQSRPLLAPNGFGARVELDAGGVTQVRYMNGSPSYLATSEPIAHFGLGAASIDEIRITWSRGQVQTMQGISSNQRLNVTAPAAADLDTDGEIDTDDLMILLAAWTADAGSAELKADLNGDDAVDVADLLVWLATL